MKKRLLYIVGAVALAVGLTACGKPNVEKTFNKIMDQSEQGFSADVHSTLQMSFRSDGKEYKGSYSETKTVDASDIDLASFAIKSEGTSTYNLFGVVEGETSLMKYYSEEEGRIYEQTPEGLVYRNGGANVTPESLAFARFLFINQWFSSEAQSKKEDIGLYRCYVFEKHLSGLEFMDLIKEEANTLGCIDKVESWENALKEKTGVEPAEIYKYFPITARAYVDVDRERLVAVKLDFSEVSIQGFMSAMNMSYQDLSELCGIQIEGLKVDRCEMTLLMESFGNNPVAAPEGAQMAVEQLDKPSLFDYQLPDLSGATPTVSEEVSVEILEEEELPSDATEVPLYTEAGKELLVVKIPEGYGFYPQTSSTDMINIMDLSDTMDCYVASTAGTGWSDLELKNYLAKGDDEYHTMVPVQVENPFGQAYMVYGDIAGNISRAIVVSYGDDYLVISFSPALTEDLTDDELVEFARKLF